VDGYEAHHKKAPQEGDTPSREGAEAEYRSPPPYDLIQYLGDRTRRGVGCGIHRCVVYEASPNDLIHDLFR